MGREREPEGGRERRRSLVWGPPHLGAPGLGLERAGGEGSGPPSLLCLPRWGEGAGDEVSGPRGGWGGVRARLRLVARSRHYAGRHFLSDRVEERCGAGARLGSILNSCCLAVADPGFGR